MEGTIFTDGEMRIARERRIKYQGGARVKIKQISWTPALPQGLSPDNLARLRGIFRKDGVHRQDLKNFVPVMTSRCALERAMSRANVSQKDLLASPDQIPLLEFEDMDLQALHGRHRVKVGSEVLAPIEQWWSVDIYLDGMHHLFDHTLTLSRLANSLLIRFWVLSIDIGADLKCSLIEEYSNENVPSDGEIYWKIRQYESENDEKSRQRWFVRLSKNKQMRLDQLDNKRNRDLRRGFNQLLQIRGLWLSGLRISMFHRVIAATAIEEILSYLDHIYETYLFFVNGDKNSLKRIESDTINSIHLMAPGHSSKDSIMLRGMILSGQVFGAFNEHERTAIWSRLESFHGIIPSLYTFFEDFKYLEACSHCVKQIFNVPAVSIKDTMKHSYTPKPTAENLFPVQDSEKSFSYHRIDLNECFDMAYRQIWLFAMRNYLLIPRVTESEDKLLAKPGLIKPDAQTLYNMAMLASTLGFQSSEIQDILINSPDRQTALCALLQARKPGQYVYEPSQIESLVTRIVECFSAAAAVDTSQPPPIILADSLVDSRARCGIPRFKTHNQDKASLFPAIIHRDGPKSDNVTTLFVRRCVYFAFFGKPAASISTTLQSSPSAKSGIGGLDVGINDQEWREQPRPESPKSYTDMEYGYVPVQGISGHDNLENPEATATDDLTLYQSNRLVKRDNTLEQRHKSNKGKLRNEPYSTAKRQARNEENYRVRETESVHEAISPHPSPDDQQLVMNSPPNDHVWSSVEDEVTQPREHSTAQISNTVRQLEGSTGRQGINEDSFVPMPDAEDPMIGTLYSPSIYSSRVSELSEPSTVITVDQSLLNKNAQARKQARDRSRLNREEQMSEIRPLLKDRQIDVLFLCLDLDHESWTVMECIKGVKEADSSEIEKKATHYMGQGYILYDDYGHTLSPTQCRVVAFANQKHRILLISTDDDKILENMGLGEKQRKMDQTLMAMDRTWKTKRLRQKSEETL
ncbi:unnamed protein product [Penicillium salamii]|uniref:Uncharacterized protein n=1 Tax=Penicillium salamii TaxID=1612424 RepID=A0A9W4JWS5_9EURO|nr:unnamed protein product [Penicillium salamii]